MTVCTEKGFALEVGGLGHPDTPPIILRCADKTTLDCWCKLEEEPEKSPRTVYMASMTQKDIEKNIGLYLQVPGVEAPLLVEENIGQSPYKSQYPAYHDYIFLTFRPMTSWDYPVKIISQVGTRVDDRRGYNEYNYEYQSIGSDEYGKYPAQAILRRPRDGYFYIFKGKRLWREILYNSTDGTLIDIDLEKYRKITAASNASPENYWVDPARDERKAGTCTETEIWIPAWIKRKKCDYSIVYSPVQWSWAHILWRESNGGAVHGLHLSNLYCTYMDQTDCEYLDKGEEWRETLGRPMSRPRFLPLRNKQWARVQGTFDQEIIGRTRTIIEEMQDAASGPFAHGSTDFEIYKNLAVKYGWDIPQCYAGADGERATTGNLLGDTAKYSRGILAIPDPLIILEMLSSRICFHAHLLNSLTSYINQNHPAAPTLQNMLYNAKMDNRGKPNVYSNTSNLPSFLHILLDDADKAKIFGNQYDILSSMISEIDVERTLDIQFTRIIRCAIYTEQKRLRFFIFNKMRECDVIEHLRSIFASNGETCISAYRLVELALEAFHYNALALDNSITQFEWSNEGTDSSRGSNSIDLLFSQKPVLKQLLFPDPGIQEYSPSKPLENSKGEASVGDGSCRLELLRKVFASYESQDSADDSNSDETPNPAAAVVRVGQRCYDYYCSLGDKRSDLIIPGAFNLIRIPSAYTDLVLATTADVAKQEHLIPLGATREARDKMNKTAGDSTNNYTWRKLSDTARVAREKKAGSQTAPGYLFCYDASLQNAKFVPIISKAAAVVKGTYNVKSAIKDPRSHFISAITVWCTLYNTKESWKALDTSDSQNVIKFAWELLGASGRVTLFFADDCATLLRTVMSSAAPAIRLPGFLAETGTVARVASVTGKALILFGIINSTVSALKAFNSGQLLPGLMSSAAVVCFAMVLSTAGSFAKGLWGLGGAALAFLAEFQSEGELERLLKHCPYSRGGKTVRYNEEQTFVELRKLTAPKPRLKTINLYSNTHAEIKTILEDFPELDGQAELTMMYWELLPDPVIYDMITIYPERLISWNTTPSPWGIHLYIEHNKTVLIKGAAWTKPLGDYYFFDTNNRMKLKIVCQPS